MTFPEEIFFPHLHYIIGRTELEGFGFDSTYMAVLIVLK